MKNIVRLLKEIGNLMEGSITVDFKENLQMRLHPKSSITTHPVALENFLMKFKDALIELNKEEKEAVLQQESSFVSLETTDDSVYKIGANGWDSGTFSVAHIANNGYVECTLGSDRHSMFIGLSEQDDSSSYETIDYAVYVKSSKMLEVRDRGTTHKGEWIYKKGDILKIGREGTVIKYYLNDELLITSDKPSLENLHLDTSLYSKGARITDIKIIQG